MASDPFDRAGVRALAMLGMWIAAGAGYTAVATMASLLHPAPLPVITPVLPLLPWTLAAYGSLGLFTLAAAVVCPAPAYRRLLRAAGLAMAVAYACFLACPMAIARAPVDGWWAPAYAWLRELDAPINACPSLHVAYAGLVLACRRWPWWMWAWGAVIAASTLTTHQHVIADAASGAALAGLAWWWAGRFTAAGAAVA